MLLPPRFQRAIDRAAKTAGKKTVHEYVAEWRRKAIPVDGDTAAAADAEAARLDAAFPKERLAALVRGGGWETPQDSATDAIPNDPPDDPESAS